MKKTLIFALCLEYHIILGCTYYKKLEDAISAYNEFAKINYKEYARLN